eukprot:2097668-Prymnesium_polylepis.1
MDSDSRASPLREALSSVSRHHVGCTEAVCGDRASLRDAERLDGPASAALGGTKDIFRRLSALI